MRIVDFTSTAQLGGIYNLPDDCVFFRVTAVGAGGLGNDYSGGGGGGTAQSPLLPKGRSNVSIEYSVAGQATPLNGDTTAKVLGWELKGGGGAPGRSVPGVSFAAGGIGTGGLVNFNGGAGQYGGGGAAGTRGRGGDGTSVSSNGLGSNGVLDGGGGGSTVGTNRYGGGGVSQMGGGGYLTTASSNSWGAAPTATGGGAWGGGAAQGSGNLRGQGGVRIEIWYYI